VILDRLENAAFYRPLGTEIALALDYLSRTDFSQTPNGRYELDGNRVFALVQRYRPKPQGEAMCEAHRQYVDVQYVAAGVERMGYAPLDEQWTVRQAYDLQKDVVFYDAQGDFFAVRTGRFVVFTPHDIHAPGVVADLPQGAGEVCKVVVKCRVASRS